MASLPGGLIASIVYPEGIHTGTGAPGFIFLAIAANIFVYGLFWYACFSGLRFIGRTPRDDFRGAKRGS